MMHVFYTPEKRHDDGEVEIGHYDEVSKINGVALQPGNLSLENSNINGLGLCVAPPAAAPKAVSNENNQVHTYVRTHTQKTHLNNNNQ